MDITVGTQARFLFSMSKQQRGMETPFITKSLLWLPLYSDMKTAAAAKHPEGVPAA